MDMTSRWLPRNLPTANDFVLSLLPSASHGQFTPGRDRLSQDKPRILYIYPETYGPSHEPRRNALFFLGQRLSGDVLAAMMAGERSTAEGMLAGARAIGGFRFLSYRIPRAPKLIKKPLEGMKCLFLAFKGRVRGGPYDAVVSHGIYRTSIIGAILARLWRIPFIVEIPGHPLKGLELDRSFWGRIKLLAAPQIVRWVLGQSHAIRLLYPSQLADVQFIRAEDLNTRAHVFHEFVPISLVPRGTVSRNHEILFVGFPWHLKGVDVLIAAFLRLADDFPDLVLRVVGYCPDLSYWQQLAMFHPRVVFMGPKPHEEILKMIGEAALFVLPSRTEAMGRVLLEAMAAETPIVASHVDGIPHYIRDRIDGLLFANEDIAGLEMAIRTVLGAPQETMARVAKAKEKVENTYSEEQYATAFFETVQSGIRRFRLVRVSSGLPPSPDQA